MSQYFINCVSQVCTSFQQVKFQYYQTYFMYDAISGGFCSVFTSFGNFIEDTDILMQMSFGPAKAFLNFSGTLLLSFIAFALGRLLAFVWKRGTRFASLLTLLENEDKRIEYETALQIEQQRDEALATSKNEIADHGSLNSSSEVIHQNYYQQPRIESSSAASNNSFNIYGVPQKRITKDILALQEHMQKQLEKKKRHVTHALTMRHLLILMSMFIFLIFNVILVSCVQYFQLTRIPSGVDPDNYPFIWFEFLVCITWSVVGALAGRFFGAYLGNALNHRRSVQVSLHFFFYTGVIFIVVDI